MVSQFMRFHAKLKTSVSRHTDCICSYDGQRTSEGIERITETGIGIFQWKLDDGFGSIEPMGPDKCQGNQDFLGSLGKIRFSLREISANM